MSDTNSIKDLIVEEDVNVNVGDSLLVGPDGPVGPVGPQGPEGKSAYEVAVENGFTGTEEEWLASLKAAIDDSKTATDTTWSSIKVDANVRKNLEGNLVDYTGTFEQLQSDSSIDTTKIYKINNTSDTTYNNHFAYYNGTSWIDGGIYRKSFIDKNSISYRNLTYDIKDNAFKKTNNILSFYDNYIYKNGINVLIEDNLITINGVADRYTTIRISDNLNIENSTIIVSSQLISGTSNFSNSSNLQLVSADNTKIFFKMAREKEIEGTKYNNSGNKKIKYIDLIFTQGDSFDNAKYLISIITEGNGKTFYENPYAIFKISNDSMPDNYNPLIFDNLKEITEEISLSLTENKAFSSPNVQNTFVNYKCCVLNVNPYEQYYIKTKNIGNFFSIFITDENNNIISAIPKYQYNKTEVIDIEEKIIIPKNGKKLYLNGYLEIYVKRVIRVEPQDMTHINEFKFLKKAYEEYTINEQLKNDFAWSVPEKLYISFIFDDSNKDIDLIEDLFESKGVPCCFATIPTKLDSICTNGETVREVLKRAIENGGEVLSHDSRPLTSDSTNEDYEYTYVTTKKILTNEGFKVNGIITAGGTNYDTQDFMKDIELARPYYLFGDLTAYITTGRKPMQYLNMRRFINTDNEVNKQIVDTFVRDGKVWYGNNPEYNLLYGKEHWLIFASHGSNDNITIPILSELIDYILNKGNIKIVSCTEAFSFGKSTLLEERIKTLENKK